MNKKITELITIFKYRVYHLGCVKYSSIGGMASVVARGMNFVGGMVKLYYIYE